LTAIISDIHGNLPALESVMKDLEKYPIDKIISLGDICGYYPFINEVIDLLKVKNVINLVGNHDRYIIDNTECPRSHSANFCLSYQKKVITKENIKWLKKSINTYESNNTSMVHGGWMDNEDEYIYDVKEEYFDNLDFKYFFCGHTHVQKKVVMKSKKEFINPGSVGQPRDGDSKAAYCIFNEQTGKTILNRVKYDIEKVSQQMHKLGFEKKFYMNLYDGSRIGGKVDRISYND